MKRVLILTASFGDGHNAAARSLRDAIELLDAGARVEVVDLFEVVHPNWNSWLKKGYQIIVRYAPWLWSAFYGLFDRPALFRRQMHSLKRLRYGLAKRLKRDQPEAVISTYPVYAHLITRLFSDRAPFRLFTVITDSISVCSAWYLTRSDYFVVANPETAEVLIRGRVPADKVPVLGFPVSPLFACHRPGERNAQQVASRPRVLYVINTGKARTGRSLQRLLELDHLELTITTGRNEALRLRLIRQLRDYGHRVRVLGWTNQMPQLLMSHDLLVAKAGGAIVQEAIAACCPMIVNQVIPGQEEGNARLIKALGVGDIVSQDRDVADLAQEAFGDGARLWLQWRENLRKVSRPDSAMRVAALVLGRQQAPTDTVANGPTRQPSAPVS